MKKHLHKPKRKIVKYLLLVLGLSIMVSFLWRAIVIRQIETARRIDATRGITELKHVPIGGVRQAISVRGHDRDDPILLVLHGGPGAPYMGFSHIYQQEWEKDFIVVNWDQRGAGKSVIPKSDYADLSLEQFYTDTKAMVEYLRATYSREKIFILGHSWGSVLGIRFALDHPERLYAYIGSGQVVNLDDNERLSYAYTLAQVQKANDRKSLRILSKIGYPPYPKDELISSTLAQRKILLKYDGSITGNSYLPFVIAMLASPDYTIADALLYTQAQNRTNDVLLHDVMALDLREWGLEFDVPMFFMQGRLDQETPASLAATYAKTITAPSVEMIWFENVRHMPMIEASEEFSAILKQKIRPLAGE